jgi:hypothetical protein
MRIEKYKINEQNYKKKKLSKKLSLCMNKYSQVNQICLSLRHKGVWVVGVTAPQFIILALDWLV